MIQFFKDIVDIVNTLVETAGSVSALVIAVAGPIIAYKQTGKIDLEKTMEAANDAKKIVEHMIRSGQLKDLQEAAEKGISLVESIRGKKISAKMKRKVAARIEGHVAALMNKGE